MQTVKIKSNCIQNVCNDFTEGKGGEYLLIKVIILEMSDINNYT